VGHRFSAGRNSATAAAAVIIRVVIVAAAASTTTAVVIIVAAAASTAAVVIIVAAAAPATTIIVIVAAAVPATAVVVIVAAAAPATAVVIIEAATAARCAHKSALEALVLAGEDHGATLGAIPIAIPTLAATTTTTTTALAAALALAFHAGHNAVRTSRATPCVLGVVHLHSHAAQFLTDSVCLVEVPIPTALVAFVHKVLDAVFIDVATLSTVSGAAAAPAPTHDEWREGVRRWGGINVRTAGSPCKT